MKSDINYYYRQTTTCLVQCHREKPSYNLLPTGRLVGVLPAGTWHQSAVAPKHAANSNVRMDSGMQADSDPEENGSAWSP